MDVTKNLLAAAVSGAVLGATGCGGSRPSSEAPGAKSRPTSSSPAAQGARHACKGQNACRGQGGCMSDSNSCRGQNPCRGLGGCKTT